MKMIFFVFVLFSATVFFNGSAFSQTLSVKEEKVIVSNDLSNVRAYPIPWKPGSGGKQDSASKSCGTGLIIDGIISDVRIRIYNLQADLVWEKNAIALDKCVAWNGKNLFGRNVASGIYRIIVGNAKGENIKKIVAIER